MWIWREVKFNESILVGFFLRINILLIVLDEQLLEESHFRKGMSQEEELKLLRRKMQDIVHAPPAEVAINKMLLGKRYSLTAYKSLHDKQQLLDEAIASGSGDVILGVE